MLFVNRYRPDNLFHHMECVLLAYFSMVLRGWTNSTPASSAAADAQRATIDIVLLDIPSVSALSPRDLAIWQMLGAVVRSLDPLDWSVDESAPAPGGSYHDSHTRIKPLGVIVEDATFAIRGFTRLSSGPMAPMGNNWGYGSDVHIPQRGT